MVIPTNSIKNEQNTTGKDETKKKQSKGGGF
jgi:hypothetical protein